MTTLGVQETESPKKEHANGVQYPELSEEDLRLIQYVIERNKFWTPEIEKLFRKWRCRIQKRHTGHVLADKFYTKLYYFVGIPNVVLTLIVATGVLATFKNCDSCATDPSCGSDEVVRILMGITSIISGAVGVIFNFINPGSIQEKHKNAADDYDSLDRKIESMLQVPINFRGDPVAVINDIRNTFDNLVKDSPRISPQYETNLEYKMLKGSPKLSAKVSRRASQDDISPFPLPSPTTIKKNADKLASRLLKKIESVTRRAELKTAEKAEKIKLANEYDTDDDEKEVTVSYDIDAVRPGDVPDSEIRRAQQDSLAKALEFELGRLYTSGNEIATSKGEETS
jgi:hypothetical protein